jgi:hypothetical protein
VTETVTHGSRRVSAVFAFDPECRRAEFGERVVRNAIG